MQNIHNSINYIELPMTDMAKTKDFYTAVFNWSFTDWGPDYISFSGANINGGFDSSGERQVSTDGVLIVLYSDDLTTTQQKVENAGGEVIRTIYEFPGGKRFHFLDPNRNHLAVWSE